MSIPLLMSPGVALDRQGRSTASTVSAAILGAAEFSASSIRSHSIIHLLCGSPPNPRPLPSCRTDHGTVSTVSSDMDTMAVSSPTSPHPRKQFPHCLQLPCHFPPSQQQGANKAPPWRGWGGVQHPPTPPPKNHNHLLSLSTASRWGLEDDL